MTRSSVAVFVTILGSTVVAAVVLLVAGGSDNYGLAMALVILVPVMLALGGGSDYGWEHSNEPDVRPLMRVVLFAPVVLGQVAGLVVVTWQVVARVVDGELVCAVGLVPLIMLSAWRSWQWSRRFGPGPGAKRAVGS